MRAPRPVPLTWTLCSRHFRARSGTLESETSLSDERASLAAAEVVVGRFTDGADPNGLPKGWDHYNFGERKNSAQYAIVKDGDRTVLEAKSSSGAPAIIR